jgi:hypothetical protein
MFLILDESEEDTKKVIGGLLISENDLPTFEADFVRLRIKHKLFGELKWKRIDQYYKRYCDFVDLFFNKKDTTYHSICYRREGTDKYRAAYVLIRTVTWKMRSAGINEPLYVLFDNDGKLGDVEAKEIGKIAAKDPNFRQKLEFCSQGTSHILGAMQIADLLTGAISATINSLILKKEKKEFVEHLTQKNNDVSLGWSSLTLPKLGDFKIHYFDPNDKPKKVISSEAHTLGKVLKDH